MYDIQDVVKSLDGSSLTEGLSKLENFAASKGLHELAKWCNAEAVGYNKEIQETVGLPGYRVVGVHWVDMIGRTLPIDFGGDVELANMASKLPIHLGTAQLESYKEKGMLLNVPRLSESLSSMLTDQWGDSIKLRGASVSAAAVQGILQAIRIEARRRLQNSTATLPAEPDLPAESYTSHPVPDLSWITDANLITILQSRWIEADSAYNNDAPLANIILLGSILEGALLHKVLSSPSIANSAPNVPTEPDGKGGRKPKNMNSWTLDNLINVAHSVGWLRKEIKDFSSTLRAYRNFVHPAEQQRQGVTLSKDICDVCWPIVSAALTDLSRT